MTNLHPGDRRRWVKTHAMGRTAYQTHVRIARAVLFQGLDVDIGGGDPVERRGQAGACRLQHQAVRRLGWSSDRLGLVHDRLRRSDHEGGYSVKGVLGGPLRRVQARLRKLRWRIWRNTHVKRRVSSLVAGTVVMLVVGSCGAES